MEGDTSETPWGKVPRRERSMLKRKARVHDDGQGNVAEETTETTTTPEWVVKLMKKYEGYDANQIMEVKELKATDLDTNQGRLSLPKHVDRIFLSIGELGTLATAPKKGVSSLFIDTNGEEYDLELRDWANGLVLTKGWDNVIKKDVFEIGEKYPLWCFRSRNDKLCFTLVKPDEEVLPNNDAKLSDTEEEEVASKNEAESSSFNHPADGHSSLPGHGQVMNASKDCDVPSGAECSDLAVNEPESESFQDVLPNVDNKDAGWDNVIKKDVFEIGEKYPLWCFRSRNDKLCFTLVKPDEEVLPNNDAKLSDTEEEEVASKNEAESSSFNHPADGHSSLPGHGQVMNASKDCDVPSGAECSDLAVNEPESESFQDVLPNVDNKDAKLSDTEDQVANKNDTESSFFGHDHPPESPAGVSSLPGEDMDLSYLDGDGYLPTEAEVDSFHLFP
ncbi:hypothetical protein F2Q69_00017086 [Brassica cretica]|uniref:TF-B3 domain-containing protein n=2 Tax=Brassica TaxID=3705 RepID=A0A8S9R554_BRACR|nr:hypothetical protein F2Q69_00017086 [Brassica cretica]